MKSQRPDHEAEQLDALRRFNILDTAPEEVIEDFLRLASHICRTPISFITLVDARRQQSISRSRSPTSVASRDVSFCAHPGPHPDIFIIPAALLDERYATNPFVSSEPDIRFYTGVPWATPKGDTLGTLCVVDHVPGGLTMDQREALHALGRQIVNQLELRRGMDEVGQTGGEGEPPAPRAHKTVVNLDTRPLDQRTEKPRDEPPPGKPAITVPQIIWTTLPDGTLDYYNHYWYNHPILAREQSQGKRWQTVLHPDDVETCLQRWTKAAQKGDAYAAEYRCKRPSDGTYRWHLFRAAPFRDQDGSIIKWLGSATDIEDHKNAMERQRTLTEELEHRVRERTVELMTSNDRLSDMAQVAAHDLQEPLRMVASYTQLLSRRYQGRLDPDADEFIKYVMDGTLRMQRMIDGLLAYSQAGLAQGDLALVDCNLIFNEVVSNLQIAIRESNATVSCDPLPTIYANPTQLVQLFQNLISNAIKFRADRPLKIHVRAEHRNGVWQFLVRDNGIGIDPQYSSQIFMLFQRLPGHAKHTGTGIGLAICKKIVESLGGRIWVESKTGEGSTFYFTLPDKEDTTKNA